MPGAEETRKWKVTSQSAGKEVSVKQDEQALEICLYNSVHIDNNNILNTICRKGRFHRLCSYQYKIKLKRKKKSDLLIYMDQQPEEIF